MNESSKLHSPLTPTKPIKPSLAQNFIAFFQLLAEAPRRPLLIICACMLIAGVSEGFGISLLAPLLGALQGQGSLVASTGLSKWVAHLGLSLDAWSALLLFASLQSIKIVSQATREIVSVRFQNDLVDGVRERCFLAILQSEWAWLSQRNNAQYANLLLTDINRLGSGITFFIQIIATAIMLLAYSAAALFLCWPLTLLVLVIGLFFFFSEGRLRKESMSLGGRIGQTTQHLHSAVQESLHGMKLVKILGNERRHLQRFLESMQAYRAQLMRFQRGASFSKARMQLIGMLTLIGMIYLGLEVWHVSLTELAVLMFIFFRIMPLLGQLQQHVHQWLHTVPTLQSVQDLLSDGQRYAEPVTAEGALTMQHDIVFDNVGFQYASRECAALTEVNLRIVAKSTTAIIGASGAGKSTLADMLMGLLPVDSGCILVDGVALDSARRLQWRRAVAYVPQDAVLFNDTIRQNLLWADPAASEVMIWDALDKAAADFVGALPLGLDTVLGDQGLRLSGGERQRIALARALLRRPSLLILDEATSALDLENEERIRQAIVNLHGDLTVVAIGHRMATLAHADQIIVVEEGRVKAHGAWDDVKQMQSPSSSNQF